VSGVITSGLLPDPPRRGHPEDDLQRSVVQFLRVALPDDAIAYAVPNGGQRHSKAAARLVGLGVRAGIPDLAIVWRGHAIFVELKAAGRTGRTGGSLSAVQRQMIDKLHVCGADVVVCKTLECVEGSLREMGVPLRASCTDWRPRTRGYDQAQLAWGAP
jgi:hypothetical protein